jgi:hypothetical protein
LTFGLLAGYGLEKSKVCEDMNIAQHPLYGKGRYPRVIATQQKEIKARLAEELSSQKRIITLKQKDIFISTYLSNNFNATEAAIAACQLTNRDTAGSKGALLLRKYKMEIDIIIKQMGGTPELVRRGILLQKGHVYVIKVLNYYKIGRTINITKRLKSYFTHCPLSPEIIYCVEVENCIKTEKELHKKFDAKRSNGEWFTLDSNDLKELLKILNQYSINIDKRTLDSSLQNHISV